MADVDLMLVGATVHTLDPHRPTASAIAVVDGRIAAVGEVAEILALRGVRTEVVDLRGRTVTPGLVDAHTHPVLGLDSVDGVDLSSCTDLEALHAKVAEAASRAAVGEWITGWGLDPNAFGSAPLGAAPFEDVLNGRPGYFTSFDGHAALASREALHLAGVVGPRDFVARSRIVVDGAGAPTGLLLEEAAMALVGRIVPRQTFDQRLRRLGVLLSDMAATGLTGGHVMDVHADSLELLAELENCGQLPLRLRLAPWCGPDDDDGRVGELIDLQRRHGRLWQVAGVKLFLDGTIDGGTAWLSGPDVHGESSAPYWRDPHDYYLAVRRFSDAGIQTATHAIGNAAVSYALDSLAACRGRHRIEHIETLPVDQIPRFAALDVAASMQPTHATDYTRPDGTDNWSGRLGPQRAARGWPCRDIVDSGAILALGSDWPVAPYDPRVVIASARTRTSQRDPDGLPVQPEQMLTPTQALEAYTRGPARASGAERWAGRIAVGCIADLTVFAADPLRVPAWDLPSVPVDMTVVDGRVRHRTE